MQTQLMWDVRLWGGGGRGVLGLGEDGRALDPSASSDIKYNIVRVGYGGGVWGPLEKNIETAYLE